MKIQKVYKAVRTKNGILESSSIWIHEDYRIEYFVDEWVEPKLGKIFAFKTLEDLKRCAELLFYKEDGTFYEAEAIISREQNQKMVNFHLCSSEDIIKTFWTVRNKTFGVPVMTGTILCDKIKLIKEVKL
jgi:hypothetical protein